MNEWMKVAIEEAYQGMNTKSGGPFGAVIVEDGLLISKAHNEVLSSYDPTAHAELLAIRRASQKLKTANLKNCVIYTTGFPCPMCLAAIVWSNISKIYYLNTNEEIAQIGFRDQFLYQLLQDPKQYLQLTKIEDLTGKKLLSDYDGEIY